MPSPRPTRQNLIEAGLATLRELNATQLVTAVGTRAIAQRAGVSNATLFHHFGSVEAYATELIAQVYDHRSSPTDDINALIETLGHGPGALRAALALHTAEFERLGQDREHRVRVGLWAFGGAEATAAYGDYVRTSDARVAAAASALYAAWGREVTPPFDIDSLVAGHAALLSGATIRHTIDPAAIDAQRFARLAVALSVVLLRTPGDRQEVDARLAAVNTYGRQVRVRAARRDAPGSTGDRILRSALRTFERRGFEQTTIGEVARVARVSPSTVFALFGTRGGLGVAALHLAACDLAAGRATGAAGGLTARLTEVGGLLVGHRELVGVYLASLAGEESPRTADDPLLGAVADAVDQAREDGELAPDVQGAEVALSLLMTLVARLAVRPADGVEAAVQHVERLCLRGLAA